MPLTLLDLTLMSRPRAYYRMSEKSGTVCRDWSGNGRTGAYVNSPLPCNSLMQDNDGARDFVAASAQSMDCDAMAVWGLAVFSIELWIVAANPPTGAMALFAEGNSSASGPHFQITAHSTFANKVRVQVVNGGVKLDVPTVANVMDSRLHHILYTESGGGAYRLDVDGKVDISGTYTRPSMTLDKAAVGQAPRAATRNNFLTGRIDEVAVYGRVVSNLEGKMRYQAGRAARYAPGRIRPRST